MLPALVTVTNCDNKENMPLELSINRTEPLTPLTPSNMLTPLTPLTLLNIKTPLTPLTPLTPMAPLTPLDTITPVTPVDSLLSPSSLERQQQQQQQQKLKHNQSTCCFIIDWDDTLLSTTFLTKLVPLTNVVFSQLQLVSLLPPDVMRQLEELEQTLFTLFDEIQHLGDVFIVTNSQRGWVELCCLQFIPRVWTWLKNFSIISARFDHESTFPNDPYMWKYTAFQKCIQRQHQSIVSFGDCPNDLKITCKIGKDNGLNTKFFKLLHGEPNVSTLNKQLSSIVYIIRNVHNSFSDYIVFFSEEGFYKFTHGCVDGW
jgi:hypothetical protein